MRNFLMALTAVSLVVPVASVSFPDQAQAKKRHYKPYVYQRNGRTYCRHSDGTTGLIIGGVGGALLGREVIGGGALGTIAGGVGGALAGRALDRASTAKQRCR